MDDTVIQTRRLSWVLFLYLKATVWTMDGLGRKGNDMTKVIKNRAEQRSGKFKMNLRFFGYEGDGAGGDGGGSGEGEGTAGGEGGQKKTFDDILADKDYQAEFDRRMQQGINTAVTKAKEKWETLMDDKVSEAEKLAKMNKDEKAQYMQQKKEKELADREASIVRKELMAEAKNTLAEKNLPAELADILNYVDADSCKKSIERVESAFQKAVEAGVQERLKGDKPMKKAPDGNDMSDLEKQIYNAMKG